MRRPGSGLASLNSAEAECEWQGRGFWGGGLDGCWLVGRDRPGDPPADPSSKHRPAATCRARVDKYTV